MAPVSPEPTRTAILDAATALFLEQGVAATALSEVAERAGITKSLIHHHFATKEKLWAAVKDQLMAEYCEVQQRMLDSADMDLSLFVTSMQTYFAFLARRPQFVTVLTMFCLEAMRSNAGPDEIFQASMGEDLFRLGLRTIASGQRAGTIRDDLEPGFILSTALGLAENWFLKRKWNMHCIDTIPRKDTKADTWFVEQLTRFLTRALEPLP